MVALFMTVPWPALVEAEGADLGPVSAHCIWSDEWIAVPPPPLELTQEEPIVVCDFGLAFWGPMVPVGSLKNECRVPIVADCVRIWAQAAPDMPEPCVITGTAPSRSATCRAYVNTIARSYHWAGAGYLTVSGGGASMSCDWPDPEVEQQGNGFKIEYIDGCDAYVAPFFTVTAAENGPPACFDASFTATASRYAYLAPKLKETYEPEAEELRRSEIIRTADVVVDFAKGATGVEDHTGPVPRVADVVGISLGLTDDGVSAAAGALESVESPETVTAGPATQHGCWSMKGDTVGFNPGSLMP